MSNLRTHLGLTIEDFSLAERDIYAEGLSMSAVHEKRNIKPPVQEQNCQDSKQDAKDE